jgi:hypothetical protein
MARRTTAAGLFVPAAIALGACGGSAGLSSTSAGSTRQSSAVYATKWEPAFRLNASGHRILSISRTSRSLTLEIVDRTCHPGDPRFADVGRRLARVSIAEQHAAVLITVYMHPEANPPRNCAPAGIGFSKTIKLPHPLSARALVDGGSPKYGGRGVFAVIRVPATRRSLERQAEAKFGRPDLGPIP